MINAEWTVFYEKLEKIVATGATVILSRLAIGDLATQYFADRNLFCAGRVQEDDLKRVAKATGGRLQSTTNDLNPSILGHCAKFEERQVGKERYNLFTGCTQVRNSFQFSHPPCLPLSILVVIKISSASVSPPSP
jgi:T-complex protein 1 subunit eta